MHQFSKLSIIVSICILEASMASFGQRKQDDPKHENHYSKVSAEVDEYSIAVLEAQSQQEFTLVKLQITNKTNDFLYFKGQEVKFIYDFGQYNPTTGGGLFKGMSIVIDPRSSENHTLKVTGGSSFHVEEFELLVSGVYKISANGTVQETEAFLLPPATNDFQAGVFNCNLDKIKKETKETSVSFKFQYQGNQMGLIQPAKITLKLENGQEYANDNRKEKNQLLSPGNNGKFNATFHVPGKVTDLQFANMELVWNNTFSESELVKLEDTSLNMLLNRGLTEGKNK